MIQSILYGWIFGIARGEEEAHRGAHIRIPRIFQYNLKYVVPVYLTVIFLAYCYQDLPSTSTKQFDVDPQLSMTLDTGRVPSYLEAEFEKREIKLPPKLKVTGKEDSWNIRHRGVTLYKLRMNDRRIDVLQHKPGRAEQVINSTGSLLSVLFIGSLFIFMLVMIHLAGRRWDAEGKFTDKPETLE